MDDILSKTGERFLMNITVLRTSFIFLSIGIYYQEEVRRAG